MVFRVPRGSVLGPLPFLLYTNDFSKSKPILFADDTSLIFTNSNLENFKNDTKIVFEYLNKWFKANRPSLNSDKTIFIQYTTKDSPQINLDISCNNRIISKEYDTKFLGLYIREYIVLEHTYCPNYTQNKYSLLCNDISQAFYVTGNIEDGSLCLFSFYYELQNNILRELFI
jgi:hypothetical protein